MNVKVISRSQSRLEDMDYRDVYVIEVDGENKLEFYDGELEDNNLSRNFSDAFSIPDLMKIAWIAGQEGNELVFENVDSDEI